MSVRIFTGVLFAVERCVLSGAGYCKGPAQGAELRRNIQQPAFCIIFSCYTIYILFYNMESKASVIPMRELEQGIALPMMVGRERVGANGEKTEARMCRGKITIRKAREFRRAGEPRQLYGKIVR